MWHCSSRSPIMDDWPLKPLTLHSVVPPINYDHTTNAWVAIITKESLLHHLCSRKEDLRSLELFGFLQQHLFEKHFEL